MDDNNGGLSNDEPDQPLPPPNWKLAIRSASRSPMVVLEEAARPFMQHRSQNGQDGEASQRIGSQKVLTVSRKLDLKPKQFVALICVELFFDTRFALTVAVVKLD